MATGGVGGVGEGDRRRGRGGTGTRVSSPSESADGGGEAGVLGGVAAASRSIMVPMGDGCRSIQSANMNHSIAMEQAEVSAKMAEKPRLEQAEDIMSKSEVKKDRKKKKRDKEVDTISQKQAEVSTKIAGKPSLEHAEDIMSKSHVKEDMKKRKRDKEVHTISQKQAEVSAKMAEKPSLEHAEDIMSKSNVKEDRKKKKRDKVVDTISQKHAEMSAEMDEKPSLQHTERIMSKSEAKKDRNKKKKDKEADTVIQKQVVDANDESIGSEYVQRNKGEGEHDIKSKKGKRKQWDGETSSNGSSGDQIVSVRDNKRKRKESSITLEESNEVDISKMGQKTVGKKKRRKEIDNVGVDLCQNSPAGDDKNCNKEKETSKDDNNGGKSKKLNMAHRKDKGKRVSFTDNVEVFNISGGDDEGGDDSGDDGLVHGRRFTPEEDAKLMEDIEKYAEMKQLGEKGLEMIRESMKHPEVRGCWAEIATSLPHRPMMAIYKRARILLYRSVERKWTQEEYEIVRWFVETNGTNWKKLATELGKSEIQVKDTWRRMKPKNLKKGPWSQDEYQNLFDLVNLDLRVKAHQKIAPSHRQLRDNISWEAISEKLSTRSMQDCCLKWYQLLASPLVKEGIWADTDDHLLIEALQKVDAVCVEDVDWEGLLDHRSGELCRQRWNQMVRLIGGHREKPFIEQVEVLARRYCPEMLDYRKPDLSDLSPDELAGGSDT